MGKKVNKVKVLSDEQLRKKYPRSGKASVIAIDTDKLLRLPSRSLAINHQLNGGPAYGKVVEIFGEESTGKSLLATDFIYCAQQLGGVGIWADAENSFTRHWFEKNGIDLDKLYLMTEQSAMEVFSDWIQDCVIAARSKLTHNEPIVIVLDSLAVVRCMAEIGESQMDSKAKFGNRAKAISDFLGNRSELFAQSGAIFIAINQLRRKIGASKFEDPDKTVGGDAMKFYASQRINIRRGKQIKRKNKQGIERKVGQFTFINTKKDKTGPPRSSTATAVYFIGNSTNPVGFSRYMGLPEILVETGVVTKKKGASRYYLGDKMIANGEDAFLKLLMEDDVLRKKLVALSPINTISKTKAKLDKITTNLYKLE